MSNRVTCIKKRDRNNAHERIAAIGGQNTNGQQWQLTEDEAITSIEQGQYSFYVSVNGRSVDVVIATHNGRKYLKTTADGYSPGNLLSLPQCS